MKSSCLKEENAITSIDLEKKKAIALTYCRFRVNSSVENSYCIGVGLGTGVGSGIGVGMGVEIEDSDVFVHISLKSITLPLAVSI
jgi:hypothetical protein